MPAGHRVAPVLVFSVVVTLLAACDDQAPPRPSPTPSPTPPQPACQYQVAPTETTLHWHGISEWPVTVTAPAGCEWTVTVGDHWLSIDRASGSGDGTIKVSAGQFTADATRRAAVMARWQTVSAGQNVWVTQEGCRYGLSVTSASFPAGGGAGTATVVTQAVSPSCAIGCPWTAQASAAWIHVTSSMPRAGDDPFSYTVDPNTGVARAAAITVADRTLTIIQAGR